MIINVYIIISSKLFNFQQRLISNSHIFKTLGAFANIIMIITNDKKELKTCEIMGEQH